MPDNVTKILDKLASIAANQALEDYQLKVGLTYYESYRAAMLFKLII